MFSGESEESKKIGPLGPKVIEPVVTKLYNITGKAPLVTIIVLTSDVFKDTRTQMIRETWGKRAAERGWRVYYYSDTEQNNPQDTVATRLEDASGLGNDMKQWKAWLHAKDCCEQPSPFYIKVDDDSYVHVERLAKRLETLENVGPRIYGQCIKVSWKKKPFCGGGAGIILNRQGLEFMVNGYIDGICRDYGHNDLTTSYCFYDNKIEFDFIDHLYPELPTTWREMANGITFHHLDPLDFIEMDKIFYGSS